MFFKERLLLDYNAGLKLSVDDFWSGKWADSLFEAVELKKRGWVVGREMSPATAAENILKLLKDIAYGCLP